MKLSKLSKEKRQHLVGVIMLTAMVLAAVGYFLIHGGYRRLATLGEKRQVAQKKFDEMQLAMDQSDLVQAQYDEAVKALDAKEATMASGDLYSWMHGTIRKLQRGYRVDIPQIGSVSDPTKVELLTNFPYEQASVTVAGSAYYHELGRFVADMENSYPLMRVQNLSLEPNANPTSGDRDLLAFRMDIVALVKPN